MGGPPQLSVILCVYNGETFLEEAIRSVLAQTFGSFEFLIVDDGSTDGTAAILAACTDRRIRVIRNGSNLGLIASLNIGLEAATGEFIARMDADDVCTPGRFQRQIDFLRQHLDIGLCGSWLQVIGEETVIPFPVTHEQIKVALLDQNPLAHPSVLFRSRLISDNGLKYDAEFLAAEDYELWTRLVFLTKLANIPEPLLLYRQHEQQVTSKKMAVVNSAAGRIKLRLLNSLELYPTEREKMIHLFLFNNDYRDLRHGDILAEADEWLNRLFAANRKFRQFDELDLLPLWKKKLLITCIDYYSIPKWKVLKRTHCFRLAGFSPVEKMKLLIKCLLKRKVGP
jgi:glycosyltransferase involved in cell wall biosynthesis